MAKKRKAKRNRDAVPTEAYRGAEGSVLTLRTELSAKTMKKIGEPLKSKAASLEDDWRRRSEMLFERLAVSWEVAGLDPLTDQAMLLGRYRMAGADEQRWVRETLDAHVRRFMPDLAGG